VYPVIIYSAFPFSAHIYSFKDILSDEKITVALVVG
jgi:hypothetical protein